MNVIISRYLRLVFVFAFAIALGQSSATAGGELEEKFASTAADILKQLQRDRVQSVGVLKFSVRVGDGLFPGSVGTLNTRLAEKLEIALVMANPAQKSLADQQVGVVRGASDVAASIAGATHLADDGRALLFSKKYPLAWKHRDQTEVIPDALIVGVAQVDSNLDRMTIELMLLTRRDLNLKPLASFRVPTDISDLIDGGESFTTRGLFDGGTVDTAGNSVVETVRKEALLTRIETLNKPALETPSRHPLASPEAPVAFEIWYDNQTQPYEFRDGAAFVCEPDEGQEVVLVVRRKAGNRIRYGILVRVNGENTLYKERTSDSQATLWIMEPDLAAFSIRGFQLDDDRRQRFRVLSQTESEQRRFDYGRDVGLISITVFPELTGRTPAKSDHQLALAVQSEARLPDETKETRGQLGTSLFDQLIAQGTTRGLVAEGKEEQAAVDTVEFQRGAAPVMSASIRYYKADGR